MLNMLRMDFRRLVRSKSFFIILAVTAGFLIFLNLLLSVMTSPETLDAMSASGMEITMEDRKLIEAIGDMTQLDFVHESIANGFLLIMSGIGMTLFASGDFTSGFIKNICFVRPRRWEYVLSKVMAAGAYSAVITLLGVALSLALPPLVGLRLAPSSLADIAGYTLWIWLPAWAFSLMALALVTVTRNVSLGIAMSIISGGGVPAALVRMVTESMDLPHIENYFLSFLVNVYCAPQAGASEILVILACVAGWGAVYIAASLLLMTKRDI